MEYLSSDITIAHQVFHDIDELEMVARDSERRDIRFTQLSLERLHCDFTMVDFGNVRLILASTNCPIRWYGSKISDMIDFGGVLDPHKPTYSDLGYQMSYSSVSGMDSNVEADTIFPPEQMFFSLQVKRSLVDEIIVALDLVDLSNQYWRHNFVYAPKTLPPVQAYLRELLTVIRKRPNFLQHPDCRRLILEDLVPLMITALPAQSTSLQGLSKLPKAEIIRQAEEYIHRHLDQPLTVRSLAEALHTSRRNLFYSFNDVFGMSPMAYVKTCRLQSIYRILKISNPESNSVRVIAERFGFWSPGHFARDYKKLFGESPRDTLKKTSK